MRGRYRQRKRLWQQAGRWKSTKVTYFMTTFRSRRIYVGEISVYAKRYRFKKGMRTFSKKTVDPGRAARQFERQFKGLRGKIDGWGYP